MSNNIAEELKQLAAGAVRDQAAMTGQVVLRSLGLAFAELLTAVNKIKFAPGISPEARAGGECMRAHVVELLRTMLAALPHEAGG
jgi:hypothetical protein